MRLWIPGFERRLAVPVIAVGVVGGVLGAGLMSAIGLLGRAIGPQAWDPLTHLWLLAAAGALIALFRRVLGDPGDLDLLFDNIHMHGGRFRFRELRALLPISILGIAAGGTLGPEAPLVQTTGSAGTWLGQRCRLDAPRVRSLSIAGMAAGFTVLLGVPIGAAIFALEILHRRGMEYFEALMPALIGSLCGYAVLTMLSADGLEPIWDLGSAMAGIHALDLVHAVGCGIAGAAIGAAFILLVRLLRWALSPIPAVLHPIIGGGALGALALWSPFALTFGEYQVADLAQLGAAALTTAAVAKLIGAALTLAAGWRGGFIIPLFFAGIAFGKAAHVLLPSAQPLVLIAGLMVGINVTVTKTPLGSTLVATGMAGLPLVPCVLVSALVSLGVSDRLHLFRNQRSRATGSWRAVGEQQDDEAAERPTGQIPVGTSASVS